MIPPVEWHLRRLADPVEWLLRVPGQPDPVGVVRKLTDWQGIRFRAVTWSARSADRTLIGYYPTGDASATAVWEHHLASRARRHEAAARTHGSRERH